MSDANEKESSPRSGGKKILTAVILVLGTLVGGGVGAFMAGPLLAERVLEAKPAPPEAEEGAYAEESDEAGEVEEVPAGKSGKGGAPGVPYLVENLVLNPAGSGGTRFLMLSVSFDVKDAAVAEEMKTRDAEVRDAVLTVLGRKTVEQLADVGARDSLKLEVKTTVGRLFTKGAVRQIYLPQFVIQ